MEGPHFTKEFQGTTSRSPFRWSTHSHPLIASSATRRSSRMGDLRETVADELGLFSSTRFDFVGSRTRYTMAQHS